MGRLVM
ncbi:hypothetical protein R3I93_004234 [Phoxinus phoxinus]